MELGDPGPRSLRNPSPVNILLGTQGFEFTTWGPRIGIRTGNLVRGMEVGRESIMRVYPRRRIEVSKGNLIGSMTFTRRRMASTPTFGGCHSIQLSYERVHGILRQIPDSG
jgi:hypothetical protein